MMDLAYQQGLNENQTVFKMIKNRKDIFKNYQENGVKHTFHLKEHSDKGMAITNLSILNYSPLTFGKKWI
ncbi:hypothetical protein MEG_00997 [Bartonella tamiae Th307]|uniref:Uncharacterized protein n=1 Tax=Bartonella tamiae Th239 TaxID=1094558 RepID=J0ZPH9_9HYPH|nr:hypothetical protein ME5_00884 [Bartonella tamiae Th239]EJF93573.1 hypothetical protein MEG_00997 [Bartonella tamiae Th307]